MCWRKKVTPSDLALFTPPETTPAAQTGGDSPVEYTDYTRWRRGFTDEKWAEMLRRVEESSSKAGHSK